MNKKLFLLAILVMGLVFGITVVGCGTLIVTEKNNPERFAELQAAAENRTGGRIAITNTDLLGRTFYYTVSSKGGTDGGYGMRPVEFGKTENHSVINDGLYRIYYNPDRGDVPIDEYTSLPSKTVTVSNGERVTVNIP